MLNANVHPLLKNWQPSEDVIEVVIEHRSQLRAMSEINIQACLVLLRISLEAIMESMFLHLRVMEPDVETWTEKYISSALDKHKMLGRAELQIGQFLKRGVFPLETSYVMEKLKIYGNDGAHYRNRKPTVRMLELAIIYMDDLMQWFLTFCHESAVTAIAVKHMRFLELDHPHKTPDMDFIDPENSLARDVAVASEAEGARYALGIIQRRWSKLSSQVAEIAIAADYVWPSSEVDMEEKLRAASFSFLGYSAVLRGLNLRPTDELQEEIEKLSRQAARSAGMLVAYVMVGKSMGLQTVEAQAPLALCDESLFKVGFDIMSTEISDCYNSIEESDPLEILCNHIRGLFSSSARRYFDGIVVRAATSRIDEICQTLEPDTVRDVELPETALRIISDLSTFCAFQDIVTSSLGSVACLYATVGRIADGIAFGNGLDVENNRDRFLLALGVFSAQRGDFESTSEMMAQLRGSEQLPMLFAEIVGNMAERGMEKAVYGYAKSLFGEGAYELLVSMAIACTAVWNAKSVEDCVDMLMAVDNVAMIPGILKGILVCVTDYPRLYPQELLAALPAEYRWE